MNKTINYRQYLINSLTEKGAIKEGMVIDNETLKKNVSLFFSLTPDEVNYLHVLLDKRSIEKLYKETKDWSKVFKTYLKNKYAHEAFIDAVEEFYKVKIKDVKHLKELTGITQVKKLETTLIKAAHFYYMQALKVAINYGANYKDLLKIEPKDFGLPENWSKIFNTNQYYCILWVIKLKYFDIVDTNKGFKWISNLDLRAIAEDIQAPYSVIKDCNSIGFLKEEEQKEIKKGNFRRSGHLTDQILKYSYPKDRQPSLFDSLQSKTKKDIEVAGVEVTQIVEGIKLTPSETKVIDCLCKLLHENSQTLDSKKDGYFTGNLTPELVGYGGDKNTPAPKLAFTLYELTREYKGGEAISGKDVENVKEILIDLDNKRFLLSYIETTKKKDGGRIERKIEDFKKLISIVKMSETEYNKQGIEMSKIEETVIILNPIFRRQIDSKFILYPNDINKRTIIAYGSHNVSDITMRLRDYLMRELSSKHYQPEIGLDRLYHLLAEKWMRESRKKKVKQYTEKALEVVIGLGLLKKYRIEQAKTTGDPKVVFTLNKDFE